MDTTAISILGSARALSDPLQFIKEVFRTALAVAIPQLDARELRPATHAIPLPKPKPRTVGVLLIVGSIGGREVARAQGSGIRRRENAFEPLDLGNGVFSIHSFQ